VLDLGVKKNILRNFDDRDVYAKVFPAKTTLPKWKKILPLRLFYIKRPRRSIGHALRG
jgi:carbamoyl-phosphate synthase small subunit